MSEEYDPYCKVCGGCGEDGCCPAIACKQSPDGAYCQTYLKELQFAYRMFEPMYEMLSKDPKHKEAVEMLFDQMYSKTFNTKDK